MGRVGRIEIDLEAKLAFPSLPREPGMYKLMITEAYATTAIEPHRQLQHRLISPFITVSLSRQP